MSLRIEPLPRPRRAPATACSALAALALLTAGCREPLPGANLDRLIASEPAAVFDERAASRPVVVAALGAGSEAERATWSLQDWDGVVAPLPAGLPRTRHGVALAPPLSRHWLLRSVRFRTVDVVEVEVQARGWAADDLVTFCWRGEGEVFAPERCLHRPVGADVAGPMRLAPVDHPRWRGDVAEIKVQLTTLPQRSLAFRGVDLLGWERGDDPAAWSASDWRITAAGTTRSGWVAAPAEVVRRTLPAGGGSTFRFAHALSRGAAGRYALEVVAVTDGGSRRLWSEVVDGRAAGSKRWSVERVELPAGEGPVRLELRARELGAATSSGFVFWGGPVVTRAGGDTRPNVILISIDTLRRDRLSLYGYRRDTSPHLARWAAERGVVFENVVSAAPWTLPSHASMLSGIYPFRHGANLQGPIPRDLALLAERFRDAGYYTAASTVGPLVAADRGFDRGFDVFRQRGSVLDQVVEKKELVQGVRWLDAWLANAPQPFFLFFHTYEPHSAYHAREPFFSRFAAADDLEVEPKVLTTDFDRLDEAQQSHFRMIVQPAPTDPQVEVVGPEQAPLVDLLYDSGVAFTDQQLGVVLDRIRALGMESRLVLAVTSDHGESLFEHGLVGHSQLYDELLMVPLVLTLPGERPGRVEAQVRSVDLAPTLLEAAGVAPLEGIDGESLRPFLDGSESLGRDGWAYSSNTNRGIAWRSRRGRKLWLLDSVFDGARGEMASFDLRRDPGEQRDLVAAGEAGDLGGFRAAALARTANVRGLHVRLHNGGDQPLEAAIGAGSPAAITAPQLAGASARYSEGQVLVTVPAGGTFGVVLQDRQEGPLEIAVWRGEEERFVRRVSVEASERAGARWRDGAWEECSCDPAGGVGWSLTRVGPVSDPARGRSESELRDDLRALGYLGGGDR